METTKDITLWDICFPIYTCDKCPNRNLCRIITTKNKRGGANVK